eukprot:TRINITY_DN19961_c0_g1_i2.p1 TRINITY_DN19961_c0_g1~~TRINITY_DN19961_c0_g1_i2.p1  ORF type:complete len:174 (+),score=7.37 TRINITY_DN19961_c0_g1_i2:7-528(+)
MDASGDGGVLLEVFNEGLGAFPTKGCKIFVHFEGRYQNENEKEIFLETRRSGSGAPFSFMLCQDQTIPGLDVALQKLREGSRALITCLPQYAYGSFGNPQGFHSMGKAIPANSTLFFQLEFLYFDEPDKIPLPNMSTGTEYRMPMLREKLVISCSRKASSKGLRGVTPREQNF